MKTWLTACAVIFAFLVACQRDVDSAIPITFSDSLFITSFTPGAARIGEHVTIRGKGFASISSIGNVQVGSVKAQIVSTSDTLLIIKILPGTPSGIISIIVGNDSVSSTRTFTILPDSLQILSFSPDSGRVGSQITIVGNNFGSPPAGNKVKINNTNTEVLGGTDSTLIIKVLPGTTSGKISLTFGSDSATSTKSFTVLPDSLKIFSFSPDTGSIGSQITIKGKNFALTPVANTVKINNTDAEVVGGTDSTLVIKVSPGTTSGKISVTYGGQTAISTTNYTITVPFVASGWTRKADCPGTFSDNYSGGFVSAFTIDGIGYYFKRGVLWAYNPLTNVWTQKASGPISAIWGFAFAIGGKAYMGLGGFGPGLNLSPKPDQKQVWQYDPTLDKWTQKNDFPGPPRIAPFYFTTATRGYVGGGDTAGAATGQYNDFWQYNPQSDQWTRKAIFPSNNIYKSGFSGFGLQDKGYVLEAGSNSPQAAFQLQSSVRLWQYDEGGNTWAQKASLSVTGEKIISASCFTISNRGYAMVGMENNTSRNNFWQYDPATNQWGQQPDFPGYKLFGASFAINGKGYLGLGAGAYASDYKKDFWEFTP